MRKRTHAILLRFSDAEFTALNNKVQKAGISREQFCRNAIQGVTIREKPPVELPQLIREVRRVGSNIDQILMIANARGLLDVPQLRKAIADLREVEKLIHSAYL